MRTNLRDRQIEFHHEDGVLVRTIAGADGRSYVHRCSLAVFQRVAWVLDETPGEGAGAAINQIAAAENLPHTQVDVALAFLFERGLTDRRHRRNYPASRCVHLDALVEWVQQHDAGVEQVARRASHVPQQRLLVALARIGL